MLFLTFWPFTSKYYYYTSKWISRKVVFGPFDHLWVDIKKATKDQFLRIAWYATIKKFLPGFNQTKMFYDQVRTFLHFRRCLFFTFSFFLWSFVYENKKQRKINFSEPLDRPCTIKEPLGDSWYWVLRNKKVFRRDGCLHPPPVISAFFFFCLESLLREQIKKQREINFSESVDMPIYILKSLLGFYKT